MFNHCELWLAPFLAEAILLLGAIWLTVCLHRVVWAAGGFPVLSFVPMAVLYVALASYSRAHELVMPRLVVLVGVGFLALSASVYGGAIVLDAFILGGRSRLPMAGLVLIPVGMFLIRCVLIFREARFTPAMDELLVRTGTRSRWIGDLRTKLRYWMN